MKKRLIDADAVKTVLDSLLDETLAIDDPKRAGVIAGTVITCSFLMDEIPTVDAVEVVRGEWDVTEDDYSLETTLKCSVCGVEWVFDDYDCDDLPPYQKFRYCPNCGAKMDGGENNG